MLLRAQTHGHLHGGGFLLFRSRRGSGFLFRGDPPALFVGDTIFAGSVGRTDLPGGDTATLLDSIRTQLLTLPDEVELYPGHGPATTVGRERKNNPYIRNSNYDQW